MHQPQFIYKIVTADALSPGVKTIAMPIDVQDGFIHFSTAEQLPETLRLYFAGRSDLLLLAVRTAGLGEALVWEPSRGGALFPHLYAPLQTAAIDWQAPLVVAADGACTLPEAAR